jgi:hypothetical protein
MVDITRSLQDTPSREDEQARHHEAHEKVAKRLV